MKEEVRRIKLMIRDKKKKINDKMKRKKEI